MYLRSIHSVVAAKEPSRQMRFLGNIFICVHYYYSTLFQPREYSRQFKQAGIYYQQAVGIINLALYHYRFIIHPGKSHNGRPTPFKAVHGKIGDILTLGNKRCCQHTGGSNCSLSPTAMNSYFVQFMLLILNSVCFQIWLVIVVCPG
jgi:hypothetical protein